MMRFATCIAKEEEFELQKSMFDIYMHKFQFGILHKWFLKQKCTSSKIQINMTKICSPHDFFYSFIRNEK